MTDQDRDQKLMQLPAATFSSLLRVLASGRSASDAAASLRALGVESAAPIYAILRSRMSGIDPADSSTVDFWSELSDLFQQLGWGTLHQEEVHPGVLSISSVDWFEAVGSTGDHPCCHFSTGLLAELFRTVAGTELAAMEVECRSSGATSCRFLVGSPSALEGVFEDMTRGGSYRDALATLG